MRCGNKLKSAGKIIGVGRLSADRCVNSDSARGCSRFAVRSAGLRFETPFSFVAHRATATGS